MLHQFVHGNQSSQHTQERVIDPIWAKGVFFQKDMLMHRPSVLSFQNTGCVCNQKHIGMFNAKKMQCKNSSCFTSDFHLEALTCLFQAAYKDIMWYFCWIAKYIYHERKNKILMIHKKIIENTTSKRKESLRCRFSALFIFSLLLIMQHVVSYHEMSVTGIDYITQGMLFPVICPQGMFDLSNTS